MSKTANKTQPNAASVEVYLQAIVDPARQADCRVLAALMAKATGCPPVMWGPGIVGFGSYHYRYESGREGDAPRVGFANRKGDISIYAISCRTEEPGLLARLGRHKAGKSCLYVRRLADVDLDVLEAIIEGTLAEMSRRYPGA